MNYSETIQKFQNQLPLFAYAVESFEKELFETDLRYYDSTIPFSSKNDKLVIYNISMTSGSNFYACKDNSEPFSTHHIKLFTNGDTFHYNLSEILSAQEFVAHTPQQLPNPLYYLTLDHNFVKFHCSPKHKLNQLEKELNRILHTTITLSEKEWAFINSLRKLQNGGYNLRTFVDTQWIDTYKSENIITTLSSSQTEISTPEDIQKILSEKKKNELCF